MPATPDDEISQLKRGLKLSRESSKTAERERLSASEAQRVTNAHGAAAVALIHGKPSERRAETRRDRAHDSIQNAAAANLDAHRARLEAAGDRAFERAAADAKVPRELHGHGTKAQAQAFIRSFISANANANTTATHTSSWLGYERHINLRVNPSRKPGEEADPLNPSESDIAGYVVYLVVDCGLSLGTAESAISAIKDKLRYELASVRAPCSSEMVTRTLRVLKPMAPPRRPKKAITSAQIRAIASAHARLIASGASEAEILTSARDCCMIWLAFHCLLRASEAARMRLCDITFALIVVGGRSMQTWLLESQRPRRLATHAPPAGGFAPEHMRVYVDPRAKNDNARRGHERLVGQSAAADANEHSCMLRMMRAYLERRARRYGTDEEGPLFPTNKGDEMSASTPNPRFKLALLDIGVSQADIGEYGFHGLRAGGATEAAAAGVPERLIKLQGNWASDAYRIYIRADAAERLRMTTALAARIAQEEP